MVRRESSILKRLDTGCDRDETALHQEQRYGNYILSQCFSYLGMLYSTLGNFVLLMIRIPFIIFIDFFYIFFKYRYFYL